MSFLKRLFGGGGGEAAAEPKSTAPAKQVEHKGFLISATPYKADGQYQTCGVVEKEIDGTLKTHKFIRADRFASLEDATQFSLTKARQLIDEQGDHLFG